MENFDTNSIPTKTSILRSGLYPEDYKAVHEYLDMKNKIYIIRLFEKTH